jgi:hypothetical protein
MQDWNDRTTDRAPDLSVNIVSAALHAVTSPAANRDGGGSAWSARPGASAAGADTADAADHLVDPALSEHDDHDSDGGVHARDSDVERALLEVMAASGESNTVADPADVSWS